LLHGIPVTEIKGSLDLSVASVCFDSRTVQPGAVFVAVAGTRHDGAAFIDQAIQAGAIAVIAEAIPESTSDSVTYIHVSDEAFALGVASANFYGNPSAKLKLVGITGTNGKTTVAALLHNLFTELGYVTGLLSTVENRIGNERVPATHTTPDPVS